MTRATLRERQRQVREDAILDAARDLMFEQGYAAMSMDDLAARVGISKATLYQHFASKEELAIRVIVRGMQQGAAHLRQSDATLPAIAQLEEMLRRGLEQKTHMDLAGAALLPSSMTNHPLYREQHDRMFAHVCSLIETAKTEGDIAADLLTPVVAQTLFHLFKNDFSELIVSGQCQSADISSTIVAMLFGGLRPRP